MADVNFTNFIFTDIIIHAKASRVQLMSVIIMSDKVFLLSSFNMLHTDPFVKKLYGESLLVSDV